MPVAGASVRNPLDTWYALRYGVLPEALGMVAEDENIHSIIVEIKPEQFRAYTVVEDKVVDELVTGLSEACKKNHG